MKPRAAKSPQIARRAVEVRRLLTVSATLRTTRLQTVSSRRDRENEMALKQLQLMVRGRVQGVYFRASAQREARRLGVTGWVKNRADGCVEIVAEGEEVAIRELYGWAQKGPSAARVDRVDTRWRSFTGDFPDFRITD